MSLEQDVGDFLLGQFEWQNTAAVLVFDLENEEAVGEGQDIGRLPFVETCCGILQRLLQFSLDKKAQVSTFLCRGRLRILPSDVCEIVAFLYCGQSLLSLFLLAIDFVRTPVLGVDYNFAHTQSFGAVEILLIFVVILPEFFHSDNDFVIDLASEDLAGQIARSDFLLKLVDIAELLDDLLLELLGRRNVVFLPHPLHRLNDLQFSIQVHLLGLLQEESLIDQVPE